MFSHGRLFIESYFFKNNIIKYIFLIFGYLESFDETIDVNICNKNLYKPFAEKTGLFLYLYCN